MGDKRTSRYFDTFDLFGTRKAQRSAGVEAARQRDIIAQQKKMEMLKLAESEDEVARRRFLSRAGGRRSLMAVQEGTMVKGTTSLLGG